MQLIGIESSIAARAKRPNGVEFENFDDEQIDLVIELCRQIIKETCHSSGPRRGSVTSHRRARMTQVRNSHGSDSPMQV